MISFGGPSGKVRGQPGPSQFKFSEASLSSIQRSVFNRSHSHKTTFNEGLLIPVLVDEVLPGDTFSLSCTAFGRMATPIFPIMDNLHMDTFFFFVPYRLVWDNWRRFMGEQRNPGDSTSFLEIGRASCRERV